jgi:hypothetical protein
MAEKTCLRAREARVIVMIGVTMKKIKLDSEEGRLKSSEAVRLADGLIENNAWMT